MTAATLVLGAHPEDAEIRLLLIEHLVRARLPERAIAVFERFESELRARADFALLRTQLSGIRGGGRCSWKEYETQYAANMAVLAQRFPWAESVANEWRSANLELHRTGDGDIVLFDPQAGDEGCWRPSFGKFRARESVEELRHKCERRVLTPLVFDGIGLGFDLVVHEEATRNTLNGASPYIYIVEPSFLAIAAALHLNDLRAVLSDERCIWCVGTDAMDQWEAALVDRPSAPLPQTRILAPSWEPMRRGSVDDVAASVKRKLVATQSDLRLRVERAYAGRDAAFWSSRFRAALVENDRPLRVLSLTSLYTTVLQYATRDAMEALNELGCETRILIEPDLHSHVSTTASLTAILEFEPDLIFMIDHTRKSQRNLLLDGLPVVTWIQDRLSWLFDVESGRSMGPLDFCMGQSATELVQQFDYPADRFLPCEMATHPPSLCRDVDVAARNSLTCEVAYATHASETPAEFHATQRNQACHAQTARLVDALYEELRSRARLGRLNGSIYVDILVDRVAASLNLEIAGDVRSRVIGEYARPLAERFLRHETIEWAARWSRRTGGRLYLYGNGWDRHSQFSEFARGTLTHGPKLGAAFRSAAVNLHAGCNPALHQRVFDGLAAGGFFLIRKHGADVSHRVARAIHEWIRRNDLTPPATLMPTDLPPDLRAEYAELRRYNGMDPDLPFVQTPRHFEQYHRLFETGTADLAGLIWPDLDQVVFGSEDEFNLRLDYFLSNPEARRTIASSMRQVVLQRFSYTALMKRLLPWMAERLTQQAASDRVFRLTPATNDVFVQASGAAAGV